MTRKIAVAAAALLLGTTSFAYAQGGHGATGSPGASQYSPGHEMQSGTDRDDRGPGASGYSPGHEMDQHGTVGQSRGDRDEFDRNRGKRHDIERGDRDSGTSELSPGSRIHERSDIDRR